MFSFKFVLNSCLGWLETATKPRTVASYFFFLIFAEKGTKEPVSINMCFQNSFTSCSISHKIVQDDIIRVMWGWVMEWIGRPVMRGIVNLSESGGAWVVHSVKRPTSAQVMISQLVSLSPFIRLCTGGSEPGACFGFCVSLSLPFCPFPARALSPSLE